MNGVALAQLVEALTEIAVILDKLGIPGLILLVLLGPALVLCAVLAIGYFHSRKMENMAELLRVESALAREMAQKLNDRYREDMATAIKELGANQDQTDQYYRDNVELVKQYEKVSKNLQDVVVGNTTAITRLITMLEERRKGT